MPSCNLCLKTLHPGRVAAAIGITEGMQVARTSLACLLLLLVGCNSSKEISRHDLAVDAGAAASLASESKLFIELRLQSKTTEKYQREHPKYLQEKAADLLKEVGDKAPPSDLYSPYQQLQTAVTDLSKQLQTLESSDHTLLSATAQHLDQQKRSLDAIQAALQ
jgi:hypothetical protein